MPQKASLTLIDQLTSRLDLQIDGLAKKRLLMYAQLLMQGLQKQRLTGERTIEGLINKQLYDSLYPLKLIRLEETGRVFDLGSGGGLPGIPIKIYIPRIPITLADANKRKIVFLQNTAEQLGLNRIYYINERAETIGQDPEHRERYDYVLCRAVAQTAVLAEFTLPLLKLGGQALIYKGPRGVKEAKEADCAIKLCGGHIEKVYEYTLITGEKRSLYVIKKAGSTPSQYPRAVGKPGRKPLPG